MGQALPFSPGNADQGNAPKKKILIVDDQPEIRHLIRIILTKTFIVHEAGDGGAALDVIHAERPDVVILDVTMPGGRDGLMVLEDMRRDPQLAHTKVVMVSARNDKTSHDRAYELGAQAFVDKPFNPLHLAQVIRDQLL